MGGPIHLRRARELRNNATSAEKKLWRMLRTLKDLGYKFRRQVPIGPFIADFACHQARLIIEADGWGHDADRDAARDAWFRKAGYETLRISNQAIFKEWDNVGFAVMAALERRLPPTPTPPLEGEGL